ncbi:MAG: phosphoglucosamine mutase, partial [Rickettsiales bacterium]|nr:phosphoglucosamine mutase [Rickettsiales bacterium]
DGLLASLEILGIMKEKNKKLSSISSLFIPTPQISKSYLIDSDQIYKNILLRSEKKLSELKNKIKNNCRLIIRKSGTENKIRIMAESKSITLAKKVVSASMKIIKENDEEK